MTIKDTLPEKPSALIRVALDDFMEIEKNPAYIIDMWDYHSLQEVFGTEYCHVCFAGVVIANTLKFPIRGKFKLEETAPSLKDKLQFLDVIRLGSVQCITASNFFFVKHLNKQKDFESDLLSWHRKVFEEYDKVPEQFKRAMKNLITLFKKYDL